MNLNPAVGRSVTAGSRASLRRSRMTRRWRLQPSSRSAASLPCQPWPASAQSDCRIARWRFRFTFTASGCVEAIRWETKSGGARAPPPTFSLPKSGGRLTPSVPFPRLSLRGHGPFVVVDQTVVVMVVHLGHFAMVVELIRLC
jgi:hypothetical protein